MPLTDTQIKKVAPGDKPVRLYDERGLYLEVRATSDGRKAAKWWRFKYRFDGKEKRLSLGTYPDTGLAAAREKRDEARKQLAAGIDPSVAKQAQKASRAEAATNSFEAVAREWHSGVHKHKVSAGHAARTLIRLEQDVFPWIGARPVAEVAAAELLKTMRRIEARGAIETTHRALQACGQVFRYAIATGRAERDPCPDLRDALKPVQTRHLAAIVEPKQASKLLRDMAGYSGHAVTRAALLLSPLLVLRPGELRHMEWAWIDLDGATLTVPAETMKRKKEGKASGVPHIVPLAPQAVAILCELQPITGDGRYVFPALTSRQRCMSENTVRSALRRLGYGNDDMSAHGFRAMARTMAAERLGIVPEVIEAQLAHAVPDALGRAYNRTQFLEQRRNLMIAWADYLDKLRREADQ